METTGQRIKKARLAANLTQTELGKKIGVQHSVIHKYENDLIVNLKSDTIAALAKALDVKPSWLMCMEDEPKKEPPSEKEVLIAQLMEHFKNLSPDQLKQVIQYARFLQQTQEADAENHK